MLHLFKEKTVLPVLVFVICGIFTFAYADNNDTSRDATKDAEYYFKNAKAYAEEGKYPEAIDAYNQGIRMKPDNAVALYNLGLTYKESGNNHEAVPVYKKVVGIKPNHAKAHFDLGVTYLLSDDKDSAIVQYETLKNIDEKLANQLLSLINP